MVRICPDGSELHTVIRVAARERRPNGAMAQLVARFHGMEEVGGSNPPSSTENPVLDQRAPVFYCLRRVFVGRVSWIGLSGFQDKTCWLCGDFSAS